MSYNNNFNQNEYHNLNSQRWSVESQINDVQQQRYLLNQKLERLQGVREIFIREKENFEDIKSSLANDFYYHEWKSNTHEKFTDNKSKLAQNCNVYLGEINDIIRSLNSINKRSAVKGEKLQNGIYTVRAGKQRNICEFI